MQRKESLDCCEGEIEVGNTPEVKEKHMKALKSVRHKIRRNDTFYVLLGRQENTNNPKRD